MSGASVLRDPKVLITVVAMELAAATMAAHQLVGDVRAAEHACDALLEGVARDVRELVRVETRVDPAGAARRALGTMARSAERLAARGPDAPFVDVGEGVFVPPPARGCTVFAALETGGAGTRIRLSQHRGDRIARVDIAADARARPTSGERP